MTYVRKVGELVLPRNSCSLSLRGTDTEACFDCPFSFHFSMVFLSLSVLLVCSVESLSFVVCPNDLSNCVYLFYFVLIIVSLLSWYFHSYIT
jgi:hypothetical protein